MIIVFLLLAIEKGNVISPQQQNAGMNDFDIPEAMFLSPINVAQTISYQSIINRLERAPRRSVADQGLLDKTNKKIKQKITVQKRNEQKFRYALKKVIDELDYLNDLKNKTAENYKEMEKLNFRKTKLKSLSMLNLRNQLEELQKVNETARLTGVLLKRRNKLLLQVKNREKREATHALDVQMKEKALLKQYSDAKAKFTKTSDPIREKKMKALKKKLDTAQAEAKDKAKGVLAQTEYLAKIGNLPKRLERIHNESYRQIMEMKKKIAEREQKEEAKLQTSQRIIESYENSTQRLSPMAEKQLSDAKDAVDYIISLRARRYRKRIRLLKSRNMTSVAERDKLKRYSDALQKVTLLKKKIKDKEDHDLSLYQKIKREISEKKKLKGSISDLEKTKLEEVEGKIAELESRRFRKTRHQIKKLQIKAGKHGSSDKLRKKLEAKKRFLDDFQNKRANATLKDRLKQEQALTTTLKLKGKKNLTKEESEQLKRAKSQIRHTDRKKLQRLQKELDALKGSTSSAMKEKQKELMHEIYAMRMKKKEEKQKTELKLKGMKESLRSLLKDNQTSPEKEKEISNLKAKLNTYQIRKLRENIRKCQELKRIKLQRPNIDPNLEKKLTSLLETINKTETKAEATIKDCEQKIKLLSEKKRNIYKPGIQSFEITDEQYQRLDKIKKNTKIVQMDLLYANRILEVVLIGRTQLEGKSEEIEKKLQMIAKKAKSLKETIMVKKPAAAAKKQPKRVMTPYLEEYDDVMELITMQKKLQSQFFKGIAKEKQRLHKLFTEMMPGRLESDVDGIYRQTAEKLAKIVNYLKKFTEANVPNKDVQKGLREKVAKLQKKYSALLQ